MTERIQTKEKMINVNKTGNGKKDVLLIFIHGLTGNYLQMHHFQKHFKETCDTLSYDLSGRGDSSIQSDPTNIHQLHSQIKFRKLFSSTAAVLPMKTRVISLFLLSAGWRNHSIPLMTIWI